jgi:hypothetical protein
MFHKKVCICHPPSLNQFGYRANVTWPIIDHTIKSPLWLECPLSNHIHHNQSPPIQDGDETSLYFPIAVVSMASNCILINHFLCAKVSSNSLSASARISEGQGYQGFSIKEKGREQFWPEKGPNLGHSLSTVSCRKPPHWPTWWIIPGFFTMALNGQGISCSKW